MSKTEINIFLASSNELKEERELFENLITKLNTFYKEFYNFILDLWEYELENVSGRKQDLYNEKIKKADIFIVLFHTKAGRYTVEEFKLAESLSKGGKKPIIFTYFKIIKNNSGDEYLNEIKVYLKKIGHFRSIYKTKEDFIERIKDQIHKLHLSWRLGIDHKKIISGKMLNPDFQESLISFNILKYIVFNRSQYINIWIGNEDIFEDIKNLEKRISWYTDAIEYRDWVKSKADKFDENNNKKAIFLIVSSVNDYINLKRNINKLHKIRNVIICFDFKSIAVSKIYAAEIYLHLSRSNNHIKLFTENKYSSEEPLSLKELTDTLKKQTLLLDKYGFTINGINKFIEENEFNTDVSNNEEYIKQFINLILKFGEHEHKLKIIELYQDFDNVIYQAIKTDLYLLEYFINNINEHRFTELLRKENRLLCLLKVADINLTDCFKTIINNKLPKDNLYKKFVEAKEDVYPKNNIQFWILRFHNKIERLIFNDLSSSIKYLLTIISPYSFEEIVKIQNDEYLKHSLKLISENENQRVREDLLAIEQNLLLYEI